MKKYKEQIDKIVNGVVSLVENRYIFDEVVNIAKKKKNWVSRMCFGNILR